MILIFDFNQKKYCQEVDSLFVTPYHLKEGEKSKVNSYFFQNGELVSIEVELECVKVFPGKKTFHLHRSRRNDLHIKKGKRNLYNLMKVCRV